MEQTPTPPSETPRHEAALSPNESNTGVEMRHKAFGVVRFSPRVMMTVYVGIGVVAIAILYGMGFFGGRHQGPPSQFGSPPPAAALQSPNPGSTSSSESNVLGLPTPPPSSVSNGTPPMAGGTNQSQLASSLQSNLNRAAHESSPSPILSPSGPLPPPESLPQTNVPEVGQPPISPTPGANRQSVSAGQCVFSVSMRGNGCGNTTTETSPAPMTGSSEPSAPNPLPSDRASIAAAEHIDFGGSNNTRPAYLDSRPEAAISRYELWAGSTIPAELDTGINTDLPGPVVAHVVSDVYDSRTGMYLLIPKNSRLVGRYDSSVTTGQARAQVVWDELIWPDGRKLNLDTMPSADTEGNAGLFADVNNHQGRIITATLITGLLAGAAQLTQNGQSVTVNPYTGQQQGLSPGTALAEGVGSAVGQTGQQMVSQTMQQPPTLTVPKGERFLVLLDRTIVLTPYVSGRL